jgi:hypothetical protein
MRMGARRKRWQQGDSFWIFLAATFGAGGVLALLSLLPWDDRVAGWMALLALMAFVVGAVGVGVTEVRRFRREGRSLVGAVLRGVGNGLRALWQAVMS